jgi:hypothetical protein
MAVVTPRKSLARSGTNVISTGRMMGTGLASPASDSTSNSRRKRPNSGNSQAPAKSSSAAMA